MPGLLYGVNYEGAKEIKKFFNYMGLPVPNEDEYHYGTGNRKLVFLSDYGVVIRLTPGRSLMRFDNRHFLKSLFTRKAGNYQIDIDPGIECPVSYRQSVKIYKMLRSKFGITVSDGKPHNLGFLPGSKPRYPVMIDLDPTFTKLKIDREAVKRLTQTVRAVKKLLLKTEGTNPQQGRNPQDKFYTPLKKVIDESWPANRNSPVRGGGKRILRSCKDFKAARKLVSPWQTENYDDTTSVAKKYQQRLRSAGL